MLLQLQEFMPLAHQHLLLLYKYNRCPHLLPFQLLMFQYKLYNQLGLCSYKECIIKPILYQHSYLLFQYRSYNHNHLLVGYCSLVQLASPLNHSTYHLQQPYINQQQQHSRLDLLPLTYQYMQYINIHYTVGSYLLLLVLRRSMLLQLQLFKSLMRQADFVSELFH